jgi:signal transduction histidine kinase
LQVLEQLLNNALRFSRKDKKPVIDIGHDKYEGSYIFCIRDNGVGISRKDHARIFEPFEKLDSLNPGNGLGLAICKSIIEKHDGKIWVESLPGHGSNFYFTLG